MNPESNIPVAAAAATITVPTVPPAAPVATAVSVPVVPTAAPSLQETPPRKKLLRKKARGGAAVM